MPAGGFLTVKLMFLMFFPTSPTFMEDISFYNWLMVGLSLAVVLFQMLHRYIFSFLGENLTLTVRKMLYEGIIYK